MRLRQDEFIVKMLEKHFTVTSLAEKAGVAPATISRMRQGKPCNPRSAYKVSEMLGVPLKELVDEW